MQRDAPDEYHVRLVTCLQSDVLAICNVLKRVLANEDSAYTVSRPPIFSSNAIQMAQDLLQNAHDNDTAREVVHVMPGSHNLYFKLLYEHDDCVGMCYKLVFCYRDKHTRRPQSQLLQDAAGTVSGKRCWSVDGTVTKTSPPCKRDKRSSLPARS
jgi:hypothetical protein